MNIGDVDIHTGNARAAVESYRKALAMAEQTVAADPANIKAQRNVAAAQARLGRALIAANEFAEALPFEQRAAAIYERVAAADPSNLFAQAEKAYAYSYLSVALANTGKGAQAIELGDKAHSIVEELSGANPSNVELRGLQASTYSMLGDVHATLAAGERQASRQADHWRAARDWYQRGYDILKALKDRGEFTSVDYGTPDEAAAKIAQCDAALAKLNTGTGKKFQPE
jgi:tetratricopeptide (TPR) repeat protein